MALILLAALLSEPKPKPPKARLMQPLGPLTLFVSMYVSLLFFLFQALGGPVVCSQDLSVRGQHSACHVVGLNRLFAECVFNKHIIYVLI